MTRTKSSTAGTQVRASQSAPARNQTPPISVYCTVDHLLSIAAYRQPKGCVVAGCAFLDYCDEDNNDDYLDAADEDDYGDEEPYHDGQPHLPIFVTSGLAVLIATGPIVSVRPALCRASPSFFQIWRASMTGTWMTTLTTSATTTGSATM